MFSNSESSSLSFSKLELIVFKISSEHFSIREKSMKSSNSLNKFFIIFLFISSSLFGISSLKSFEREDKIDDKAIIT